MDPNDDSVRSMADLLHVSQDAEERETKDVEQTMGTTVVVCGQGQDLCRQDSLEVAKGCVASSALMRDDVNGIDVEPSIITETTHPSSEVYNTNE